MTVPTSVTGHISLKDLCYGGSLCSAQCGKKPVAQLRLMAVVSVCLRTSSRDCVLRGPGRLSELLKQVPGQGEPLYLPLRGHSRSWVRGAGRES